MSKETYFEMCEMLGSEPIDEEIPVEYEDLPEEAQQALSLYNKLRDDWNVVSGDYMGKNMSGILDIFEIMEIAKEDRKFMLELINLIDVKRQEVISERKANTPQPNVSK